MTVVRIGPPVVLAVLAACGSAPIATGDGAVHQITWQFQTGSGPTLLVLAVDDAATAQGVALRERFARALSPSLGRLAQSESVFETGRDPAAWSPLDLRVVIVHASVSSFVGPTDVPALALTTEKVTPADIDGLAAAVASEVKDHPAPSPDAPYPLLDATDRALRLFTRQRAPEGDREMKIVASLPAAWSAILVTVASSRDDLSAGPPEPLARLDASQGEAALVHACGDDPASRPRLEAWARATGASSIAWTCGASLDPTRDTVVDLVCSDFVCQGPSRPISLDAAGHAACTILFSAGLPACDASRGWADPLGNGGERLPRWADGGQRVCEILQSGGPDLAACRTSIACDGCVPGYCLTQVSDLLGPCGEPSFRFLGGAAPAGIGFSRVTVTCDLEP